MTSTSVKNNNLLPPGLVSNLQQVLSKKNGNNNDKNNDDDNVSNIEAESKESDNVEPAEPTSSASVSDAFEAVDTSKPIVLVTNGDGIDSPGLVFLVEALVREGLYNVHVCAPQSDKSVSGHSVTLHETVAVSSTEINGSTAFEVSGTPVDCVSLALSGALFSWSKPLLVISGINRGSSCGHRMFYSGVVAGAREALICGVPSLSISLNWKKDESQENDFKDAVSVCIPLINAAIRDIEKGVFPKSCSLNIEIPTSPLTNKGPVLLPCVKILRENFNSLEPKFLMLNIWKMCYKSVSDNLGSMDTSFKGFKLTKQSMWRSTPNWLAVSANRYPAGHFMSNQQSLGLQLAQLGRDASAAGAARRLNTQKKHVEIESVGVAGKSDSNRVKKYFRLEFLDKEQEETDEDLDFRALENGYVAITPLSLSPHIEMDIQTATSDWISAALPAEQ